jgi:hypothetical protein
MKKLLLFAFTISILFISISGSDTSMSAVPVDQQQYIVIAWNDLGMHCMDKDYSVFSILPPFNNLHAQVVDRYTGMLVNTGTLTYKAAVDTRGSINTTSIGKTNFWDWVLPLFGVPLQEDIGLTGNPAQSLTPAPMVFNPTYSYWQAEGIPVVPYDDSGNHNFYPMVKVALKGQDGTTLAATKIVLPVSDEMRCKDCHKSETGDPAARPSTGWVNDPNPLKDVKRNILKLHDEKNISNPLYTTALATNGYNSAGLLATADSGTTSILCANCHASNALGKPGINGINPLTEAVHLHHSTVTDDNTGLPLENSQKRFACYYCHPGSQTQCLRGAMGKAKDANGKSLLQCQSCHGSMSKVGTPGRIGWVDLPSCQHCHYLSDATGKYVRDSSVFDSLGNYRQATSIFTTGLNLYKISAGHGNVQCEACHGATHAEYPASEANDNVQSINLQGYKGTIAQCSVCHQKPFAVTSNGGPHGLHTIGQEWVNNHRDFAGANLTQCATCHGPTYTGTFLSKTFTNRNFIAEDSHFKTYIKGTKVSCYDCHNGPSGD